ncbi:unnamed protein product [Dicrocoelium dendriticum]|nr:unnamed protein product [Dicrocoelium dendriticum]
MLGQSQVLYRVKLLFETNTVTKTAYLVSPNNLQQFPGANSRMVAFQQAVTLSTFASSTIRPGMSIGKRYQTCNNITAQVHVQTNCSDDPADFSHLPYYLSGANVGGVP